MLVTCVKPDSLGSRIAGADPRSASTLALFSHGCFEAGFIDSATLLAEGVLRQIEREAKSVIKLEGNIARKGLLVSKVADFVGQKGQA